MLYGVRTDLHRLDPGTQVVVKITRDSRAGTYIGIPIRVQLEIMAWPWASSSRLQGEVLWQPQPGRAGRGKDYHVTRRSMINLSRLGPLLRLESR